MSLMNRNVNICLIPIHFIGAHLSNWPNIIMFFQGDLRDGINAAIEQSKLVACYVRSPGRYF